MLQKLLKKNTLWIGAAEIWYKIITFSALILIARVFGDTIFGQIAFVMAYLQIFQEIFHFGLHMILVRDISQYPQRTNDVLANYLGFKLLLAIGIGIGIFSTTLFLQKPTPIPQYIALWTLPVFMISINEMLRSVFRGQEKFKIDAISKIAEASLLLVFVLIGISIQSVPITLLAYGLASTIGFIIVLTLLHKQHIRLRIKIHKQSIITLLKNAWPLALASLFVVIYFRIDTIMLSYMHGDEVTGWYNAAYNFIYSFIFIPGFIMMSLLPKLSQYAKKNNAALHTLYKQSLGLLTVLGIIFAGICFFGAEIIITVLYGSVFSPAIVVLKILTIAVFFSYVAHVWLFTLTALAKQHIYTWAVGGGMILNVVLNFIFIPKYSLIAAAWTTVATEIITGIIIWIACHYFVKNNHTTLP